MESKEDAIEVRSENITDYPLRKDVVGLAGQFVDDFVTAMDAEGIYRSMGIQGDKTFLLAGRPGTGKTLAVRAINNELNKDLYEAAQQYQMRMIAHPDSDEEFDAMSQSKLLMFSYDIGKYGTAYINMGSKTVQTFFDTVGLYARYGKKVLVVMDEADALLANRMGGGQSHAEDKKVLETIMKNIQIAHDTPNMYVALMTNLPEACDEASLRAGRIDRKYIFQNPTLEERVTGFEKVITRANEDAGYSVVRTYDTEELAELTEGMSYADIASIVEHAIRSRATEVARDRTELVIPAAYVTQKRLLKATEEHAAQFKTKRKSPYSGSGAHWGF